MKRGIWWVTCVGDIGARCWGFSQLGQHKKRVPAPQLSGLLPCGSDDRVDSLVFKEKLGTDLQVKYPSFEMWAMNWKFYKGWRSRHNLSLTRYSTWAVCSVTCAVLEACSPTVVTRGSQMQRPSSGFPQVQPGGSFTLNHESGPRTSCLSSVPYMPPFLMETRWNSHLGTPVPCWFLHTQKESPNCSYQGEKFNCEKCDGSCVECKGPGTKNCTVCPANLVLFVDDGRCLHCCNGSDSSNAQDCCDCRNTTGELRGRAACRGRA